MTQATSDSTTLCARITDRILAGMAAFIPSKTLAIRATNPRWWTPECDDALAAKSTMAAYPCPRRPESSFCAFRQPGYCCPDKSSLGLGRPHSYTAGHQQPVGQTVVVNPESCLWRLLKLERPTLIVGTGREHATNCAKANCLTEYFANKCSLGMDYLNASSLPPLPPHRGPRFTRVYFRTATVQRLLAKLDIVKATGSDAIPTRVLKECAAELAPPLTTLFSLSFNMGVQPSQWKGANVVSIY